MALNYMKNLVEEICLEGLDGITLQGLWERLEWRKEGRMVVDESARLFLWRHVQRLADVQMFLLPEPRPPLTLPLFPDPDRPVEEVLLQIMQHMKNLYPYHPVDKDGVKGSCSTYDHRIIAPIEVRSMSYHDCVQRYGDRLVVVGSQEMRARALVAGGGDYWREMSALQYCVLEAVGRGRHAGVYSYGGPGSVQEATRADPRAMFYVRQRLLARGAITKQLHLLRANHTMCRTYLLQLTRMRTPLKSHAVLRQERLLHALQHQPLRRMVYTELRDALQIEPLPFKKMTASMHANGIIDFKQNVPYREMYPSATPEQYLRKGGGPEKVVRVVILKRDTLEEPKPEGEEDSDEENADFPGLLEQSGQTLDRPLVLQAYAAAELAGAEGLTQKHLGHLLGLSKLDSRAICRQLTKEGFVSMQLTDVGRQRITRYTAIRQQRKDYRLVLEKEKFVALTGSIEMLEAVMFSGKKAPRNFVLGALRKHAHRLDPPQDMDDQDNPDASSLELELPDDDTVITYRVFKRVNLILALIMKHKVISDFSYIQKTVNEEEMKEGYTYKMDRKSLFRLIAKLQKIKCIKLYKAMIKSAGSTKSLTFVCTNDVESDNSLIQTAIAQAQFRPGPEEKRTEETLLSGGEAPSVAASVAQLQGLQERDAALHKLPPDKHNQYGHCPRFVRMRLMHQLLFYLTWDYSGSFDLDQEVARDQIAGERCPADCPPIFRAEALDFRTFAPPLPTHEGWGQGWCLLADLVLRVPLSVYVRLVRVRCVVPGLQELLADPVRRHCLLVHLPRSMRLGLLGGTRRFVYALFEAVQKLCFAGLVQFGPQRHKDKDQLFLYVNRRALLLDTTGSTPAYFKVDATVDFPRHVHIFSNLEDVAAYWSELYHICMSTKLGTRFQTVGTEVVIETADSKQVLLESCAARGAEEAAAADVGVLPGDQLGAAGLDSAMFGHLRRNWNGRFLAREQRLPAASRPLRRPNEVPPGRVEVRPRQSAAPAIRAKARITRRLLKKRTNKPKLKNIFDEPFKFRVKWSREEDYLLILCKVASLFLMVHTLSSKLPVRTSFLARMLARHAPSNVPKNTNQSLRRMNFLNAKSDAARSEIAVYLDEAHQCPQINARFGDLQKKLRTVNLEKAQQEVEVEGCFEELVLLLRERQKQVSDCSRRQEPLALPDTMAQFHRRFSMLPRHVVFSLKKAYNEPRTEEDVHFNLVINLILSALSVGEENCVGVAEALQQAGEGVVRAGVQWLRRAGVLAGRKKFVSKDTVAPLAAPPFTFALSFYYMIQAKIPFEVFQEARPVMKMLEEGQEYTMSEAKTLGGHVALLLEGLASGFLSATIDASSQAVSVEFDPSIGSDERLQLNNAFQLVQASQRRLDTFQESDETPSKRPRMEERPLLLDAAGVLSDDEEDELEEAAGGEVAGRVLSGRERLVKEVVEARLAFYVTRERLQGRRSVNEKRDKRARLTIAACPLRCVPRHHFPLQQHHIEQVLLKIHSDAVFSGECPVLSSVLQSYSAVGASEADTNNATLLIQMISEAKYLGLTIAELRQRFCKGGGDLSLRAHLDLLSSVGVIAQVGVTTPLFVHAAFQTPWLLPPSTATGPLVGVRPWVRVDGLVLRRPLDRLLAALLLHCVTAPGLTLATLQARITPALPPAHVHQLVQILVTLSCLTATLISRSAVGLFSKPLIVETGEVDFTEGEDCICLEATADAILRITRFIGEKHYNSNFLDEIKNAAQIDAHSRK